MILQVTPRRSSPTQTLPSNRCRPPRLHPSNRHHLPREAEGTRFTPYDHLLRPMRRVELDSPARRRLRDEYVTDNRFLYLVSCEGIDFWFSKVPECGREAPR